MHNKVASMDFPKLDQTRFSRSSSPSSWSLLNSFHAVVSTFNLFTNSAKEVYLCINFWYCPHQSWIIG
uniref:Ovule protein n=1 Tax=Romanomermis culicivorax TaxID=13658 RepID=A0A915I310_ROMCU